VRPRKPAQVVLGEGTYHKDSDGSVVIDDPLITLKAQDFAVDLFAQLDERMVRLFTIVGDLDIPVLLFADGQGRLQPILGSLDKAFTNMRLENSDLITEDSATLANLFPTVLTLASTFLAAGFDPIELPSIQNLKLILDEGSIKTLENRQILAIFAKLGLVQQTGLSLPLGMHLETQARLARLTVPPTAAFELGPRFRTENGPAAQLALAALLSTGGFAKHAEYSYRIDGGFYHPWVEADDDSITIHSPLFWLQGKHTIEVIARLKGQPQTTALSPAVVQVAIDSIAPRVQLVTTAQGVRAEVQDGPMPAEEVQLSWRVNGGSFSPYASERSLVVSAGTPIEVRARDQAGNVSHAAMPTELQTAELEQGGCAISHGPQPFAGVFLQLLAGLGIALYWSRRASR
jgi:hypothetical protein